MWGMEFEKSPVCNHLQDRIPSPRDIHDARMRVVDHHMKTIDYDIERLEFQRDLERKIVAGLAPRCESVLAPPRLAPVDIAPPCSVWLELKPAPKRFWKPSKNAWLRLLAVVAVVTIFLAMFVTTWALVFAGILCMVTHAILHTKKERKRKQERMEALDEEFDRYN